ncbi:MAG: T9SS type A sorting domain-containing protein [Ignavibacteriae bacterium]|nr:T9SS type A sorting domain-containing protein [Ignavibacteriota bacterium]
MIWGFNPFNPSTRIRYFVGSSKNENKGRSFVEIKVLDILGREVSTLVHGMMDFGYHETVFDARDLPSGIYFYRFQCNGVVDTKKLVLTK